jgi:hypothetical protein
MFLSLRSTELALGEIVNICRYINTQFHDTTFKGGIIASILSCRISALFSNNFCSVALERGTRLMWSFPAEVDIRKLNCYVLLVPPMHSLSQRWLCFLRLRIRCCSVPALVCARRLELLCVQLMPLLHSVP